MRIVISCIVLMISVVKMELYSNTEKADYDSYWGSYTFDNK